MQTNDIDKIINHLAESHLTGTPLDIHACMANDGTLVYDLAIDEHTSVMLTGIKFLELCKIAKERAERYRQTGFFHLQLGTTIVNQT